MNPIVFAMKHPIARLMLVVALVRGGFPAYSRMRVDIHERAQNLRLSRLRRVIGGKAYRSPSMCPDDPDSVYYDPHVYDRPGAHDDPIRAAEGGQAPPLAAT